MRSCKAVWLVPLLFQSLFLSGPHNLQTGADRRAFIPGLDSPCAVCHRTHNGGTRRLLQPPRSLQPSQILTRENLVSDRDLFCMRCHTDLPTLRREFPDVQGTPRWNAFLGRDLTVQHPVAKRSDLPALGTGGFAPLVLDADHRILCVTCHDPHRSLWPALLRRPVRELCLTCHTSITRDFHHVETSCERCHSIHRPKQARLLTESATRDTCLQCHPGRDTPHGTMPAPERRALEPRTPKADHERPTRGCPQCHRFHTDSGLFPPGTRP